MGLAAFIFAWIAAAATFWGFVAYWCWRHVAEEELGILAPTDHVETVRAERGLRAQMRRRAAARKDGAA